MYKLLENRFEHEAGALVYSSREFDYGLASEDTDITGIHHVSVTLNEDGSSPFFTVPYKDLEKVS